MWTFELHSLSIARISLWEPQPKTLWPQPRGYVWKLFNNSRHWQQRLIDRPVSIMTTLLPYVKRSNHYKWGSRWESPDSIEIFLSGAKKLVNQYEWKVFRPPDLLQYSSIMQSSDPNQNAISHQNVISLDRDQLWGVNWIERDSSTVIHTQLKNITLTFWSEQWENVARRFRE